MSEQLLEHYPLKAIKIVHADEETLLQFDEAALYVDTADISYAWFVDISGVANRPLLNRLSQALDIAVMMYARTETGLEVAGRGHLHPSLTASHAALRGDGELFGYEQIRETSR